MQPLASLEHPAPASKVSFEVPRDLRRELAGAIAARNEADGRARAAREIADRADRLKTELEAPHSAPPRTGTPRPSATR